MTFANRWSAFAARLGTSPRQLAILLTSALIAIGIFGGKLVLAPKSAAAAVARQRVAGSVVRCWPCRRGRRGRLGRPESRRRPGGQLG